MKTNNRHQRLQIDTKKFIEKYPGVLRIVLFHLFGNPPEPDLEVNLFDSLSWVREWKSFMDLGISRYLYGKGYIVQTQGETCPDKKFNFCRQKYRLTQKGLEYLSPNQSQTEYRRECEQNA